MTHYLSAHDYDQLVTTLADQTMLDSFDPLDRRNAIKLALCELGDVVPVSPRRTPSRVESHDLTA